MLCAGSADVGSTIVGIQKLAGGFAPFQKARQARILTVDYPSDRRVPQSSLGTEMEPA